jgi:phosphatidylglycerol---prolipoprotein diacylglyceryl transferase
MTILTIPFPDLNPVAFELGPLAVKWYGLAYLSGLLLGWVYVKWLLKQDHLWPFGKAPFSLPKADDLLLYMTIGVLLGGRMGYVLFYEPAHFFAHPMDIPQVWHGGMAFHGALLGSILAIVLFAYHNGANPWSVLDLCATATPMGLFFGRLANFINGELWGRPTSVSWAMIFPGSDGQPRHPSQLYEATLEGLVLFLVILYMTHARGSLRRPGLIGGTFMAGYGLARSTCEFFREPDPGHWLTMGPFTAGILYSLPMIAIGVWAIVTALRQPPQGAADAAR